jgi:hypothetical protein
MRKEKRTERIMKANQKKKKGNWRIISLVK